MYALSMEYPSKKQTKLSLVLFIASASRSGSTLLDLLLGSHPQGVSTGEIRRLQGFVLQDKGLLALDDENYPLTCSCAKPLKECAFWMEVEKRFGASFKDTGFKTSQKRSWRSLLMAFYLATGPQGVRVLARAFSPVRKEVEIGLNCLRLHEAVSLVSGACFVVDSSKSVYHYMLLHCAAPKLMKLIVLVRDGRGVAHSMVRGTRAKKWQEGPLPPFLQASRQWARTTKSILMLSRRTKPSDKVLLRYEEICSKPLEVLNHMAQKWGLLPWEDSFWKELKERHIIGGSPSVRFEKLLDRLEPDNRWKHSLDKELLEGFEKIAGKLNRKLGYLS